MMRTSPQPAAPLFSSSRIRAVEHAHASGKLMEKAGQAAAMLAHDMLGENGYNVLIIAGPGNNGGDALVAARHLRQLWYRVTVVVAGDRDKLPKDAFQALEGWLSAGGEIHGAIPAADYDLVIDGLFGIGLSKPLQGSHAELVAQINALQAPVLSLDVPSGLCADTGRILGHAVRASRTLTFIGLKPGLFTLDGPDHAGIVHATDLGIPEIGTAPASGGLLERGMFQPPLPQRANNSHKGSFGSIAILGGSDFMTGAALLAARAALLIGAGRVYAGLLAHNPPAVDFGQPELMLRAPETLFDLGHLSVLVAGPGLGHSVESLSALQGALLYPGPLLLDADALTLLAVDTGLIQQFRDRPHGNIVTPHPGEAARLLDCSAAEIQADRVAAALAIARNLNAITVLKGAGSIIAAADGSWFINPTGNPGLSSAGTGDVLAGLIGGLIAQREDLLYATMLGVHVHGAAADALVARGTGPIGLTASEVALEARDLINQWMRTAA